MNNTFPQFINQQDIYRNVINSNTFRTQPNQSSFGMPVVRQDQYETPNLLYNNVSNDVVKNTEEHVYINIDSSDRDTSTYTNPFSYRVRFNPLDTDVEPYLVSARVFDNINSVKVVNGIIPKLYNLIKTTLTQSGTIFSYIDAKISVATTDDEISALLDETETVGSNTVTYANITSTRSTTSPYLLTGWTIEFIVDLDSSILYSYTYSDTTTIYVKYQYDTTKDLSDDRFLLLNIDELKDTNIDATNSDVAKSFAVLYPDTVYTDFYHIRTYGVLRHYKSDDLKKLSRLTVSFKDSFGTSLSVSYLNFDITTGRSCECTTSTNYRCSCNYIRHPYFHKLQHSFVLKLIVNDVNINRVLIS
jgi:hypothetical protein